jgi:alpha-D-ribose 1-methylphosphonate 5-triphosphate synthase subunit PhnL
MLVVNNISKHFTMHIRGGVCIPSFSGVSFEVRQGALLALTGPSGIGKSSVLKCICLSDSRYDLRLRGYCEAGAREETV